MGAARKVCVWGAAEAGSSGTVVVCRGSCSSEERAVCFQSVAGFAGVLWWGYGVVQVLCPRQAMLVPLGLFRCCIQQGLGFQVAVVVCRGSRLVRSAFKSVAGNLFPLVV